MIASSLSGRESKATMNTYTPNSLRGVTQFMMQIDNLELEFPSRQKNETPTRVLNGVSLGVKEGEFVALLGPSGCGKSSILNIVAGLMPLTKGNAYVNGESVSGIPDGTAYMFQRDTLLPWENVSDNIKLPLDAK